MIFILFYIKKRIFFIMPRNQLTKDEIKVSVLKLKNKLQNENHEYNSKQLANQYLNQVLDKIDEYYR